LVVVVVAIRLVLVEVSRSLGWALERMAGMVDNMASERFLVVVVVGSILV
jgi:hypothetical protein